MQRITYIRSMIVSQKIQLGMGWGVERSQLHRECLESLTGVRSMNKEATSIPGRWRH